MSVTAAELVVRFSSQGAAQVKSDIAGVGDAVEGTSARSTIATAGAGLAMGDLGKNLLDFTKSLTEAGANYQQEMAFINSLAGGTQQTAQMLQDEALKLDRTTVFSAQDIAAGMEQLAREGFTPLQIAGTNAFNSLIQNASNMAAALRISMPDAANMLGMTMRAFNIDVSQTAATTDILTEASLRSGKSAAEFNTQLQYVEATAAQLGIPLQDISAAVGELMSQNVPGAGQGLRAFLVGITAEGSTASKEMAKLGISAYDAKGNFIGLGPLIDEINTALSHLSPEEQSAAIKALSGGNRQVTALIQLLRDGSSGLTEFEQKMGTLGGASKVMSTLMDNAAGSFKAFASSLETAKILMGESIAPLFRPVTDGLRELLGAFIAGPNALHAFAAAGIAVTGALFALTGAVAIFKALDMGVVFGEMFGGIAAAAPLLLAVAAGGALFYEAWQHNFLGIQSLITGLIADAEKFGAAFKKAFSVDLLRTDPISATLAAISSGFAALNLQGISLWFDHLSVATHGLYLQFSALAQQVMPSLNAAWREFGLANDHLVTAVQYLLAGDLPDALLQWHAALTEVRFAWDDITTAIGKVATAVGAVTVNIAAWAIGQIPSLQNWLTNTLVPFLITGAIDLGTLAVNIAGWFAGKIADLAGWLDNHFLLPLLGYGLKLGTLAVDVAGWTEGKIADLAGWLGRHLTTYALGFAVKLGTIAVDVAGWVAGRIPSLLEWLAATTLGAAFAFAVNLPTVTVNIFSWGRGHWPDLAKFIAAALGTVSVPLSDVLVTITSPKVIYSGLGLALLVGAALGLMFGGGITLAAVPVAVPIVLTLGAVVGAAILGAVLAKYVGDWFANHPAAAIHVATNIDLTIGHINAPALLPFKLLAMGAFGIPLSGVYSLETAVNVLFTPAKIAWNGGHPNWESIVKGLAGFGLGAINLSPLVDIAFGLGKIIFSGGHVDWIGILKALAGLPVIGQIGIPIEAAINFGIDIAKGLHFPSIDIVGEAVKHYAGAIGGVIHVPIKFVIDFIQGGGSSKPALSPEAQAEIKTLDAQLGALQALRNIYPQVAESTNALALSQDNLAGMSAKWNAAAIGMWTYMQKVKDQTSSLAQQESNLSIVMNDSSMQMQANQDAAIQNAGGMGAIIDAVKGAAANVKGFSVQLLAGGASGESAGYGFAQIAAGADQAAIAIGKLQSTGGLTIGLLDLAITKLGRDATGSALYLGVLRNSAVALGAAAGDAGNRAVTSLGHFLGLSESEIPRVNVQWQTVAQRLKGVGNAAVNTTYDALNLAEGLAAPVKTLGGELPIAASVAANSLIKLRGAVGQQLFGTVATEAAAAGQAIGSFAASAVTSAASTVVLQTQMRATAAAAAALAAVKAVVTITGDNSGALASIGAAVGALGAANGLTATDFMLGDNSNALASIGEALGSLFAANGTTATTYIDCVDSVPAEVGAAAAALASIAGTTVTTYVNTVSTGVGPTAAQGGVVGNLPISRYPLAGIRGFADGGLTGGSVVLVGEQGPELAYFPNGTYIQPHGASMNALRTGVGGVTIQIGQITVVQQPGQDGEALAIEIMQTIARAASTHRRGLGVSA